MNPPAAPLADAVFDHYQVLSRSDGSLHELGRGAMGITYKALDTNLQVPVALKVINAQTLNTALARENFVREARAAARLRHPHVASVFHLGMEGATCFYAMEYIAGETVESVVKRRGPLPSLVAARLAEQVARALMAAEEQGLVHRDIKPSNLMLVTADRELCVKVIDFGLAISARESGAAAAFAGTPQFASPEQLAGRAIDIRSDIFSLGATLWYLLTGHSPFAGPGAELMTRQRAAPLPLEELAGVPTPLAALLGRMLATEPAGRPASAAALREELERVLEEAGGESDETLAEEAAIAGETSRSGSEFPLAGLAPGGKIAGRLEVLTLPAEVNEGWICQARDAENERDVRLLVLRQDLRAEPEALTALEHKVASLARISHPHLLAIYGLETEERATIIITEWCDGITLREVLRLHRELSASEVLALLEQLAPAVDHALAAGLTQLDLSLHQILIHFPGLTGEAGEIVRAPLAEWPPFQVKVNPLVVARDLALTETWSGAQTMVDQQSAVPSIAGEAGGLGTVRELPLLVYELLGGALKAGSGGSAADRYTPLANLTEEGNEVLHDALDPATPPASGADLLRALRGVRQLETRHRDAAAPSASAPAPPPAPTPAPRRSLLPFAVAAIAVLGGGGASLLTRPSRPAAPSVAATPEPEPQVESLIPPPSATPSAVTPSPVAPDPREPLKVAVAQAERTEETGDLTAALPAWVDIAKQWPDSEVGRMRMELLLDKVRLQRTRLSGPELEHALPALREAAGLGVVSAMLLLGESLQSTDPEESFRWFSAAGAKGVAAAYTQMGLMYSNGRGVARDLGAAVDSFEKASAKGDSAAKAALAECFLGGKGVAKDEAKAIELLRQAAGQGNLRAMSRLANCYHQGTGVPKNFAEALRLYQTAADGGFPEAIGNLGVLYINGEGVPPNPLKAVELFQKGARLDDGYCMFLYAKCLESGTGVTADAPEAQSWYKRSALAGFPRAIDWCRQHGVEIR